MSVYIKREIESIRSVQTSEKFLHFLIIEMVLQNRNFNIEHSIRK